MRLLEYVSLTNKSETQTWVLEYFLTNTKLIEPNSELFFVMIPYMKLEKEYILTIVLVRVKLLKKGR